MTTNHFLNAISLVLENEEILEIISEIRQREAKIQEMENAHFFCKDPVASSYLNRKIYLEKFKLNSIKTNFLELVSVCENGEKYRNMLNNANILEIDFSSFNM